MHDNIELFITGLFHRAISQSYTLASVTRERIEDQKYNSKGITKGIIFMLGCVSSSIELEILCLQNISVHKLYEIQERLLDVLLENPVSGVVS